MLFKLSSAAKQYNMKTDSVGNQIDGNRGRCDTMQANGRGWNNLNLKI